MRRILVSWLILLTLAVLAPACDDGGAANNANNANNTNNTNNANNANNANNTNNTNNTNNVVTPMEGVSDARADCILRRAKVTWTDPQTQPAAAILVRAGDRTVEVAPGVETVDLTGLPDDTELTFGLRARAADGRLSEETTVSCRTPAPSTDYLPPVGPYLTLLTPAPEPVHQTPTALDPSTHMVVHYESAVEGFSGTVFVRPTGETAWLEAPQDPAVTGFPAGFGEVHHFTLAGLTPDTAYEYQVLGPDGALTPVFEFRTLPAAHDRVRFLVLGDNQDELALQRWAAVAAALVSGHLDEFDFIVHVGDMAKDDVEHEGERHYWWRVFFEKGRELFARRPIYATPGNHDTPANPDVTSFVDAYWANAEDTLSFRKYFYIDPNMTLPDDYHFSAGCAFFAVANTEVPVFYGRHPERDTTGRVDAQRAWLNAVLGGPDTSRPWVFVVNHVPPFAPSGGKDEVPFVRPYVTNFHRRVDWNLAGHVHQYQRTRPLVADADVHAFAKEYGRQASQGVGYLMVPPAGQWPRAEQLEAMDEELASYPMYAGNAALETGFTIIQISGEDFSLRTWGLGDVNARNPAGYGDTGGKRLLDALNYTRRATPSTSDFPWCHYRGSTNGWKTTAMTLVEDSTWEITVLVTPGEAPGFKFFTDHTGERWYGDDPPLDGLAHSWEAANLAFPPGAGAYTIRFHDVLRHYTVTPVP